jgi:hypothetical protein
MKKVREKRQKQPSLYELRMRLSNLAEDERNETYARYITPIPDRAARRYNLSHLDLGLTLSDRAIEGYQRSTLLAVIEASTHPAYSLIDTMRGDGDETSVRNTAIFFGTMHHLGISERMMAVSLHHLSEMSGASDLSELHNRSPEGAKALLRLSYHATRSETATLNGQMNPDLLEMVMDYPEKTDALIEFIEQRRVSSLAGLHPQLFLDAISTESQSMRDGVL